MTPTRRPIPFIAIGVLALAFVFASSAVSAGELALGLQETRVFQGEATILQVAMVNPDADWGTPTLPAVDGLVLREAGRRNVVSNRSAPTTVYLYEVSPVAGRAGNFALGPAQVKAGGGKTIRSNRVTLSVYKKPKPGIRFGVGVTPEGGPVGSSFRVVYTVYYSGEANTGGSDDIFSFARSTPFGLSKLSLPILGVTGIRLTPVAALPEVEGQELSFRDGSKIIVQRGFSAEADGTGYRTLVFGFDLVPLATGEIRLGRASVALQTRTGKTKVLEDGFFRRSVPEVVEHEASTEDAVVRVRELPEEGRPLGFNGAVGRFRIDQVTADPTEVSAYSPITLQVRVSGAGFLEDLRAPLWSEVESLTRDFDVVTDVDSGKVDGEAKVFQQKVRPKSEKVTEIPPIPFPYFDPGSGKYEVAYSAPTPIKVTPTRTVDASQAIPSARTAASSPDPEAARPAALLERDGIGANFRTLGRARPSFDPAAEVVSPLFAALLLVPPIFWSGILLAGRLRRRDPALRARARAGTQALAALSKARDPAALSAAYQDCLRSKFGLSGEVTPAELAKCLSARGAGPRLVLAARDALEEVQAAVFGVSHRTAEEIAATLLEVTKEIEAAGLESPRARDP